MTEVPRFFRETGSSFFLFGPRGTGKSTWLRAAFPQTLWLDLLGGRALRCAMHPFMAAELGDRFDLRRALVEGLVPAVWAAEQPARTLAAYLALYVREEVKSEGLVRQLGAFSRFLEVVEDLLLAFRVPVFTRRAKRIVAQHLRAWIDYSAGDLALHFWRTKSGNEVDFVVYGRDGFYALEVKSAATVRPEDLRGLRAFAEDYPSARRALLYSGKRRLLVEGVACVPVELFLRELRPGRELPIG